jgi:hypothetical protein
MTCFTVSELERKLALFLNLPIYGCNPSPTHWGSKSGSRKIFRDADIDRPFGFEDIVDAEEVSSAFVELKAKKRHLRRAVVKLNDGFSGERNEVFDLEDAPADSSLLPWVRARLSAMTFEAGGMTWDLYQQKRLGCRFPANRAYRLDIQKRGMKAARVLASKGVLGRFGIDFISVNEGDAWRHLAIEINLRKGGTTHPFLMLQFLTAL